MEIPAQFLDTLRRLLGEADFLSFQSIYTQPAMAGLRGNSLKIDPQALAERLPYALDPLPWCASGFLLQPPVETLVSPGKHPYHAAGLYYLQDPSAMLPAELLAPQPGARVLDLCAAPGGKTTHLAALMHNCGLLVANEIHPGRAWELAENLERCGVTCAAILNETPARLAQHFPGFFDAILVDAPCSGEGMFRKSAAARQDWSSELVQGCAVRQGDILEDALHMLRPGGRLVYSTCTFNPLENEAIIARLLAAHSELELLARPLFPGLDPGRPDWVENGPVELRQAARLWPHHAPGEGHFAALLRHKGEPPMKQPNGLQESWQPASPPAQQAWRAFVGEHLTADPTLIEEGETTLVQAGSYLYGLPNGLPVLKGLKVIHPGWWLGTLETSGRGKAQSQPRHKGWEAGRPAARISPRTKVSAAVRFEPSHALALGLHPSQVRRTLDLPLDDPRLPAYLRGEALPWEGAEGWTLITVDGFSLGWARAVPGRLQNAYPKGLRVQL